MGCWSCCVVADALCWSFVEVEQVARRGVGGGACHCQFLFPFKKQKGGAGDARLIHGHGALNAASSSTKPGGKARNKQQQLTMQRLGGDSLDGQYARSS
eukprot:scaffold6259_cov75-Skeletonema_marinoi.AAC.12